MGRQREREQKGTLYIDNGKVYVRYVEHHRDGNDQRVSKCIGTTEKLNTKGRRERARADFMRTVNESAEVTYWEHLCDDYQRRGIDHTRESTQKGSYAVLIRKLRRAFEGDRVDWLESVPGRMKMENWLANLVAAKKYRQLIYAVLAQIFEHARRWDMINSENPCSKLRLKHLPRNTRPKRPRTVITPAQFAAVFNDPLLPELGRTVWALEHLVGIRSCEALGLKWSDIQWDGEPKIRICRSVKKRFVEEPKTEDSKRTVALPQALARILLRWRGSSVQVGDWVFGSTNPKRKDLPWEYRTVHNYIKAAAQRAGFDYVGFGQHNPRHTFRSNMKKTGASLEDQGKAMGHSRKNLEQTLSYGVDIDNAAELAPYVEKVAEMLTGTVLNSPVPGFDLALNCQLTASESYQIPENKADDFQFNKVPIY